MVVIAINILREALVWVQKSHHDHLIMINVVLMAETSGNQSTLNHLITAADGCLILNTRFEVTSLRSFGLSMKVNVRFRHNASGSSSFAPLHSRRWGLVIASWSVV